MTRKTRQGPPITATAEDLQRLYDQLRRKAVKLMGSAFAIDRATARGIDRAIHQMQRWVAELRRKAKVSP